VVVLVYESIIAQTPKISIHVFYFYSLGLLLYLSRYTKIPGSG